MRWAVITVLAPNDSVEAVSYALIKTGCGGVMQTGENLVKVQGSLPDDEELEQKLSDLKMHLARLPEWELPAIEGDVAIEYAEEDDWASAWKQYYRAEKPGTTLVICPSWQDYRLKPGEKLLMLDPGMAFGTGSHPTTRLCLLALEDEVEAGMRVADIGTGSGILSIAAALLGAQETLATDSDLLPRKVARENVARNGLQETVMVLESEEFYERAWDCDLIVANIVANTILELLPEVVSRLKQGGVFIASGIVEDHSQLMQAALAAAGFDSISVRADDIWVALTGRLTDRKPDMDALHTAMRELPPLGSMWAN